MTVGVLNELDQVFENVGRGCIGSVGRRILSAGERRCEDCVSHSFKELVESDLPESSWDVVFLRKSVMRSGESRIESEL